MEMSETAQIHTLEGFVAAAFMIMTVMLIAKSSVIISPQSELSMDVQLRQSAADALTVLDLATGTEFKSNLTEYVAGYNLTESSPQSSSLKALDTDIGKLLEDTIYNVDFVYVDNNTLTIKHVITHGAPTENTAVASSFVTLYNSTVMQAGGTWNISLSDVKMVEVRLIAWQV
jgi:hypothetical protein